MAGGCSGGPRGFLGDDIWWFGQYFELPLSCDLCVLEDSCQGQEALNEHRLYHPRVVHLDCHGAFKTDAL